MVPQLKHEPCLTMRPLRLMSERLAQGLCLPRANQNAKISGIAGVTHRSPLQSFTTFTISPVKQSTKNVNVTAIVVPQATCDLPIPFKAEWSHLSNLQLADPGIGYSGKIDLLGVDVFVAVLLHGRGMFLFQKWMKMAHKKHQFLDDYIELNKNHPYLDDICIVQK